ncbi:MAG: hypothetical protein HQK81_04425, partial [Desulfovibrionaceae bacterium]|nr:hypothetical protein [Desulfovibrionaceae bacterium]
GEPAAAEPAPNAAPAEETAPSCPVPPQAQPEAVDISGAWEARTLGSAVEIFVAQKGVYILSVAYVTQQNGKISVYHMSGFLDNGKVHAVHGDGLVFDGRALGPDSICGALAIKNYPIKIETTATRRAQGRLRDEQADAFFRDMLPKLPDPPQ